MPLSYGPAEIENRLGLAWRIVLTIVLLAALALLSLWTGSRSEARAAPLFQSSGDPLVLAFYYTWFDENTWTYDKLSDLPAEPYVSRDRGVMGRHIDQAKAAGIDGFLVAWYGPGSGNQTEPNLTALLEEAAARNFKIGILFETDSPFLNGVGGIVAALQHAQSIHFGQPAYLRVDGRPVVFFWRNSIYGVDTWRSVRDQVDPGYAALWVSEGVNTAFLAVFDGHHLYSNTWNPPADLDSTNQKFARLVEDARQQLGRYKFWVATVMPGYDDVRIRANAGFARDREGGAYYSRSWQAAIASRPNWVVITSFNEWPEGTYIEPSAAYGDQYLGLTATWSRQFKAGGGLVVDAAALGPPPVPTPLPEPDAPTVYVQTSLLNLRAAPSTQAPIVGQVYEGAALPITGRSAELPDWWQIAVGGQTAWVYAPLVRAAGPLIAVPTVAESPLSTPPQVPPNAETLVIPLAPSDQLTLKPVLSRLP